MSQTVPPRFLFRMAFTAPYVAELSETQLPVELPAACTLPSLAELDGQPDFAELRCGWNEAGLAISVSVRGKTRALKCDPASPKTSDGLQLWIDTRCTQNVHRATRFCQHFCVLPAGRGAKRHEPLLARIPLSNARDFTARTDDTAETAAMTVESRVTADGYQLSVWFPAESLSGFDPESHPKLGFYAVVRDTELGEQFLTVGRDFPIDFDPSMWQVLELIR